MAKIIETPIIVEFSERELKLISVVLESFSRNKYENAFKMTEEESEIMESIYYTISGR